MYKSFSNFKIIENHIKRLSTQIKGRKNNHYDALGVSAKATQADIKTAYYKLSMIHHPDKNAESEASSKFRDITEAYEILGNVKSRKLYDRGLLLNDFKPGTYDDTPINKFYKSRETKSRPPSTYTYSTVYDFDEWSKAHYGATFRKDLFNKNKKKQDQYVEDKTRDDKSEQFGYILLVLIMVLTFVSFDKSEDDPKMLQKDTTVT